MTYWKTPCSRVLTGKLKLPESVKKFSAKRMFITVFKTAATCRYQESDASSPVPSITRLYASVLILSFHLRLGLPRDLILSSCPIKAIYMFCYFTYVPPTPSHPTFLFDPRIKIMFVNINLYWLNINYQLDALIIIYS